MEKKNGILQYIKNSNLTENEEDLLVLTSGAGGVFMSGIPIGVIKINEDTSEKGEKVVKFYKDFSQLKYVKIVSYLRERGALDMTSKDKLKEIDDEIEETNQEQEALRILLEQKKIADETRVKIIRENDYLKAKITKLENEMLIIKKTIQQDDIRKQEILFLELNLLYEKKCKKTFYNKLYVEGSKDYKNCILNKGMIKKN